MNGKYTIAIAIVVITIIIGSAAAYSYVGSNSNADSLTYSSANLSTRVIDRCRSIIPISVA